MQPNPRLTPLSPLPPPPPPSQDEALPPTWEPPANLADNLLRDYEDRWWRAAREGDAPALRALLAGGPRVLSNVVDEARRSALHYAAGKGSAECVELLCRAGAALDLTDKEGEKRETGMERGEGRGGEGRGALALEHAREGGRAGRSGRPPAFFAVVCPFKKHH